jgi:hypothetical protein
MSQIETIGGKNAIILVQNLMPSLRNKRDEAMRGHMRGSALPRCAHNDGVRCRKINTIWLCVRGRHGKEERAGRCPYSAEHEAGEMDCDILPITRTAASPVDLPVRARSHECCGQGARAFSLRGAMGRPEPGIPCAPLF